MNSSDDRIAPAGFQPPEAPPPHVGWRPRPLAVALLIGLVLFAICAWLLLTARSVTIATEPPAENISIETMLAIPLAGRWLLRPGEHTVAATRAGYHPLSAPLVLTADGDSHFEYALEKLPGRLDVRSTPAGASVRIDGEEVGITPLEAVVVAPGERRVEVRAPRHESHIESIAIRGMDERQEIVVALTPAWAEIRVESAPAGATLFVDDEAVGETPLTAEVGAGSRTLRLSLDGYESWRRTLQVEADVSQKLAIVQLEKARGMLQLRSTPGDASVSINGDFQGRTPLELRVRPAETLDVRISKAGHAPARRTLTVPSGETRELTVALNPEFGEVAVQATPEDAELLVDGRVRGTARQTLRLLAVPTRITVRKAGFETFETTVTPKPGVEQAVAPRLRSDAEVEMARLPARITAGNGTPMVLLREGRFTMGAPRREQGRRANEVERAVALTRPFYMAIHEVSNAEFRKFRSTHSSGIIARETLDNDNYPVVRVSWQDAVAYCNWLSARDGLPAAYRNGELVQPVNTGYRLPSEAEWAWAARFAGNRSLKYPWGDEMPPPDRAGNFADVTARNLVDRVLDDYNDTYATTAPLGRFSANALGIYDLGGNVSEWMHDRYSTSLLPSTSVTENPFGASSGEQRVVRGSSWRHGRITELRLSWRDGAAEARDDLGFRIVRYAE